MDLDSKRPKQMERNVRRLRSSKQKKKEQRSVIVRTNVSEEMQTGVIRLKEMDAKGELPFHAVNVKDCVTKSKIDNVYSCYHSLNDDIMRVTDVMIGGERALVYGYDDASKGCTCALSV